MKGLGKIRVAAVSILGVLVLVVVACAPAATPTPTATPTPPPVVATPTPGVATPTPTPGVATPTPAPVATPTLVAGMPVGYGYSPFGEWGMPLNMPPPQYGGILRDGYTTGMSPPHFDGHRNAASSVAQIFAPIMDPLIRVSPYLDYSIIPSTYQLEYLSPNLAEKWEVSQDGLTVTFYLKRGVKWHDGKPFTAKDVKYSLEKLKDPTRSIWTPDLAMVDRVDAVDDYTVKAYLKYPASRLFVLSLAMNQLGMEPEHLKDVSYRTTDFLVGTGAFKFMSFTPGIEFVLTKNPDYHFKGRPYFDGYRTILFPTKEGSVEAMVVGQIDHIEQVSGEQNMELVAKLAPQIITRTHMRRGAISGVFVSFVREGPWQDVRVRKAMAMVLDRREICVAGQGLKYADAFCSGRAGYFTSAPLGRGLPFEVYEKAWLLDQPVDVRVREAKKLLAEAGYPNGFEVTLLDRSTISPGTLVIMDQLGKMLNIKVTAKIVSYAAWTEAVYSGNFDIQHTVSVPHIGAMEQYVSNIYIKGGQYNFGLYTHPEVEKLYLDLLQERDMNKALALFHRIERFLIDDVPMIPTYASGQSSFYWPYVKPGIFTHPLFMTAYNSKFSVVWFDKNDSTWAKRVR